MKAFLLVCSILLGISSVNAQKLYIKTFGDPVKPAVIFLHGGPGYNSAGFEATTAQTLADTGFYVIVCDRRGEGRSKDLKAAFTFQQTIADLDSIINALKISKVSLIGHSFGGAVAIRFAEQFPQKTNALVLVGAPLNLQETFRTILRSCRKLYEERGDTTSLKFLTNVEKMDSSSLAYSSILFGQAMRNGFYTPKNRTEEAKQVYERLRSDSTLSALANSMTSPAVMGFYKNEHYTTLDLRPDLRKIVSSGIPVYGMYGQEDGLYSESQIRETEKIVRLGRLKYFPDCSHNVFIDQQKKFVGSLKQWLP